MFKSACSILTPSANKPQLYVVCLTKSTQYRLVIFHKKSKRMAHALLQSCQSLHQGRRPSSQMKYELAENATVESFHWKSLIAYGCMDLNAVGCITCMNAQQTKMSHWILFKSVFIQRQLLLLFLQPSLLLKQIYWIPTLMSDQNGWIYKTESHLCAARTKPCSSKRWAVY